MPLRTIPPESAVEWADKHFWLSPESSNVEGKWKTAPYQVVPLNLIGNDDCEELFIRKSARIGYTKLMVAGGMFLTQHKRRNGVTYQPTDDDVKDFVQDEIDPAIRDIKVMRDIAIDFGKKSANNKAQKKRFHGAVWDFKGGKSPKNFRRLTKDFAQADECNGFDWSVGGGGGEEGDPMALIKTRLIGSPFPKFIAGTTPTTKARSHIGKLMDQADVVLKMFLPCPHCNHMQPLRFGGPDCDFGFKYLKDSNGKLVKGSAAFMCENPDCHCLFEMGDLYDMQVAGRWQNDDGSVWTKDGLQFYDENDCPIETPQKIGIDIWAAYSLHDGWDRLASRHISAVKDVTTLRKFVNTDLGQDWEDDLAEEQSWERLHLRRERYQSQVPKWGVYITGGIDTQDNRVEFYVWAWGADFECWLIWHEVIMGRPDDPDVKKACKEAIHRVFTGHDGQPMGVNRWGWDSQGHYHGTVMEASRKYGLLWVIPVHGSPNYGRPIANMPKTLRESNTYATEVGTDTAKEWIYAHLAIDQNPTGPTPGYVHLPLDESICDESVCKQLVSEVRICKYVKGKQVITWDSRGKRNEALDCLVYALAALMVSISRFGINLNDLSKSLEMQDKPESPVTSQMADKISKEKSINEKFKAFGRQLGAE
ncbi:MAG: terminase gpA endonuclease subunit [Rickettsiales bacterium]